MAAKFEIYLDKAKKHRFRFKAANGETIASGEAYESKAACMSGIKSIQKNAPTAAIVDETVKKESAKKAAEKKPAAKKAPAKKAAAKSPAVKKAPVKKAVEKAPAVKKAAEEPAVKKEPELKPEGLPQVEKADA